MKEMNVIYCIKNTINQYMYIGSAHNFNKRKHKHISDLKNNIHHSKRLQNSWNKNGESIFIFKILERVASRDFLIPAEQIWLDTENPQYNSLTKAGSLAGFKHSEETKLKMSLSRKGKICSEEHKEKIRVAKRNVSLETRKKLSDSSKGNKNCLGNICSDETKRKISLANSMPSPETREKLRQSRIGKGLSEDQKKKIGDFHRGKPWSDARRLAHLNKDK